MAPQDKAAGGRKPQWTKIIPNFHSLGFLAIDRKRGRMRMVVIMMVVVMMVSVVVAMTMATTQTG